VVDCRRPNSIVRGDRGSVCEIGSFSLDSNAVSMDPPTASRRGHVGYLACRQELRKRFRLTISYNQQLRTA
jgi:hypothetical protein